MGYFQQEMVYFGLFWPIICSCLTVQVAPRAAQVRLASFGGAAQPTGTALGVLVSGSGFAFQEHAGSAPHNSVLRVLKVLLGARD